MKIDYIKCHGSGNEFVMVDAVRQNLSEVDLSALSVAVCSRSGIGADGILLLVEQDGLYGMRMFNPDGSEAEMCGNGIRCVARLAEHYLGTESFVLTSGGGKYPTARYAPIFEDIPTYGVEIAVRLSSGDFGMMGGSDRFVGGLIPQLHPSLRWTAISVGNPHIVAVTDSTDLEELKQLGRRVIELKDLFPNGVNVSLVEIKGDNHIFVTTFERGAGITPSCGTAMTSSATAMALQGLCSYGKDILVENRGGAVRCICSCEPRLSTTLIGNATYTEAGVIDFCCDHFAFQATERFEAEVAAWNRFLESR